MLPALTHKPRSMRSTARLSLVLMLVLPVWAGPAPKLDPTHHASLLKMELCGTAFYVGFYDGDVMVMHPQVGMDLQTFEFFEKIKARVPKTADGEAIALVWQIPDGVLFNCLEEEKENQSGDDGINNQGPANSAPKP